MAEAGQGVLAVGDGVLDVAGQVQAHRLAVAVKLAGYLVVRPLLDHKPASHHGFADVFAKSSNRAIGAQAMSLNSSSG